MKKCNFKKSLYCFTGPDTKITFINLDGGRGKHSEENMVAEVTINTKTNNTAYLSKLPIVAGVI